MISVLSHLYNYVDNNKIDDVKKLLKRNNINLNEIHVEDDKTPIIFFAIFNGDIEMVNLLIEYGADINIVDNCNSTVIFEAIEHDIEEQEYFSTLNEKEKLNRTPVEEFKMIKYVLSLGVNVNAVRVDCWGKKETPLDVLIYFKYYNQIACFVREQGGKTYEELINDST